MENVHPLEKVTTLLEDSKEELICLLIEFERYCREKGLTINVYEGKVIRGRAFSQNAILSQT